MGVMIENDPLEDSDPRTSRADPKRLGDTGQMPSAAELMMGEQTGYGVFPGEGIEDEGPLDPFDMPGPTDEEALQFIQQSDEKGKRFFQEKAMEKILQVYRAARNEHPAKSKYLTPQYRQRSTYHRPKTRNAIKRMQTAAANALFTNRDTISIIPGDESNKQDVAAAALRKEMVEYRTNRTSGRNAIPWLLTVLGGRTDAYQTGYTISLQTWNYRRRVKGKEPIVDQWGQAIVDPMTGQPAQKNVYDVIVDRPEVTLYPIENTGIDPNAPWIKPAQGANFLYLKDPIYSKDLEVVMNQARELDRIRQAQGQPPISPIKWRDPKTIKWSQGRVDPNSDSRTVRTERADGATDRHEDMGSTQEAGDGNVLVWRYLWFMRWEGEDYCFYTLGTRELLSDPRPTSEAFPYLGGERPVVIGTDLIAPHDLLPMSNAAVLQPMQEEINDQVNLRIDAQKQSVYPLMKVRRGRNIDITSLSRRGPGAQVMVEDKDDVITEGIPNGAAPLFNEMDRLNNDFDETAGIFSNSSVQGQRAMNETVGGMKILSGDAHAVANLELRIWSETWVEPVIGQLSALVSTYETDERILAICGQRAKLDSKFGINVINDDLLLAEVQTIVDIGTGAADPNESIGRFKMAMETVWPYLGPEVAAGRASINVKEIANEVFARADFKDGGDRFVSVKDQDQPTPEAMQKLQQELDACKAELQELKIGKAAEKEIVSTKANADMAMQEDQQKHEKQKLLLQAKIDMIKGIMGAAQSYAQGEQKASHAALTDQRKGAFAEAADKRKSAFGEAADERQAGYAQEKDRRAATMSERGAVREDRRSQQAAQQELSRLEMQVNAGDAAGKPSAGGMPPGAPQMPPGGPPMQPGGPPMPTGPDGMPPPEPGTDLVPAGPEMGGMDDMMAPVVQMMQQAMTGMAEQLIGPLQEMLMAMAQEQAATQAQVDILMKTMVAPQKFERGADGRVTGASRDLSGIDLSKIPEGKRGGLQALLGSMSKSTAQRGEDGRVNGATRERN